MANMMMPQPNLSGVSALQQRQPRQEASFWKGAPGQWSQQDIYNPQQMSAIQQIIQQALSGLQNPTQGYEPFAQAARQNLQENTLPGIAERFGLMGKGAASSGAFQGMLGRAASDLESGLAQGASQYGQQNQQLMQNLLGLGLRPTFENVYQQREASGIESLLPHLIQAGGQLGGAYLSGGSSLIPQLMQFINQGMGSGQVNPGDISRRANYSTRGGF